MENSKNIHKESDSYYTSRYTPDPARSIVWKEIVRHHAKYIKPDATVVDLGAGYCDFINNVKANVRYAVDHSPELQLHAAPEIKTIRSVVWQLNSIAENTVDVVHASNLLEHLDDKELEKTMNEIKRILKKGGILILQQPNYYYKYREYFDDPTHKKVFSHEAFSSFLISYSFTVDILRKKFLPFSLRSRPSFIKVRPWMIRLYINSPFKPFAGQMLVIAHK